MNRDVRSFLIELARKKGKNYIHYQELSDACGLGLNMRDFPQDRLELGAILGRISMYEWERDRPLLSSLVITHNGEEGDGFFKMCEELGYGNWKKLKQDVTFPSHRMMECYEFWQDENNYKKFRDD